MKIFIDNGHGQFREAFFNREIARRIVLDLQDRGYDAELLVPEDDDISLRERCRRVNSWCLLHGKQNAILVCVHVNAYGNGSGWTQPVIGIVSLPVIGIFVLYLYILFSINNNYYVI